MFLFSSQRLNHACNLCLFGYLFCSSLRLNSQSSRDKVPAPRLAPHVSWNNLVRHVLLGPHLLNPGLAHLFIEPSPHPSTLSPARSPLTLHTTWQRPSSSLWPKIYANSSHSADLISPGAMSNKNYAEVLFDIQLPLWPGLWNINEMLKAEIHNVFNHYISNNKSPKLVVLWFEMLFT